LATNISYIYDGKRVIQERNYTTPLVAYTRGNDLSQTLEGAGGIGGLLAWSVGNGSGGCASHAYYHADGNGNITYLETSAQGQGASYEYDPYGNLYTYSGSLAAGNVYRFSSKECHVNSGMYSYLYRFYDPELQRWVNRDPIQEWGGINLYTLCYNNPQGYIDPEGESAGALALPVLLAPVEIPPSVIGGLIVGIATGTAYGGWQLGTWINNQTGASDTVGDALAVWWVWVCESKAWQHNNPNPWKHYRPKDPKDPSKDSCKNKSRIPGVILTL
jgi:RHS repeat-associated protein